MLREIPLLGSTFDLKVWVTKPLEIDSDISTATLTALNYFLRKIKFKETEGIIGFLFQRLMIWRRRLQIAKKDDTVFTQGLKQAKALID